MEIKNKTDYLEQVHRMVRSKYKSTIREIIEYCKTVDLDAYDYGSVEARGEIQNNIRGLANNADNLMEIAGILFEFDTMAQYRINNEENLLERINELIKGYELATYRR